jgi:hypothetical protein
MILMQAIGFKAEGYDAEGVYDCSFMITFPLEARPDPREVQRVEQDAIRQFKEYHPTGQIRGRMEKRFMINGANTWA